MRPNAFAAGSLPSSISFGSSIWPVRTFITWTAFADDIAGSLLTFRSLRHGSDLDSVLLAIFNNPWSVSLTAIITVRAMSITPENSGVFLR